MNKKILGLLILIGLTLGLWLILRPHGVTRPTSSASKPTVPVQTVHTNQSKPIQSYPSVEERAMTPEQKRAVEANLQKAKEGLLMAIKEINRMIENPVVDDAPGMAGLSQSAPPTIPLSNQVAEIERGLGALVMQNVVLMKKLSEAQQENEALKQQLKKQVQAAATADLDSVDDAGWNLDSPSHK